MRARTHTQAHTRKRTHARMRARTHTHIYVQSLRRSGQRASRHLPRRDRYGQRRAFLDRVCVHAHLQQAARPRHVRADGSRRFADGSRRFAMFATQTGSRPHRAARTVQRAAWTAQLIRAVASARRAPANVPRATSSVGSADAPVTGSDWHPRHAAPPARARARPQAGGVAGDDMRRRASSEATLSEAGGLPVWYPGTTQAARNVPGSVLRP
jgi:hypothetical protein